MAIIARRRSESSRRPRPRTSASDCTPLIAPRSSTWKATNSLRAAWRRIRFVLGAPQVIGGEIAVRLLRNHFATNRMDFVQFIEDGDLGLAQTRQRRAAPRTVSARCRAAARRFGSTRAPCRSPPAPTLPAPSTARTAISTSAPGFKFRSRRCIRTLSPAFSGQGDEIARHLLAVHGHEETDRPRRSFVRRRGPGNPCLAGRQILDLGARARPARPAACLSSGPR